MGLSNIWRQSIHMKLSILIPSVFERYEALQKVTRALIQQIGDNKEVELLVLLENKRRPVGAKRNDLLTLSRGDYVVFVDDDDRVTDDYVSQLLLAIDTSKADCIVFDVSVSLDGRRPKIAKYDHTYKHGEDRRHYYRKPNHLMCYRRSLAVAHKFQEIGFGEDDEWGARASQEIKTQHRIEKVLYHYDYVTKPRTWYAQ